MIKILKFLLYMVRTQWIFLMNFSVQQFSQACISCLCMYFMLIAEWKHILQIISRTFSCLHVHEIEIFTACYTVTMYAFTLTGFDFWWVSLYLTVVDVQINWYRVLHYQSLYPVNTFLGASEWIMHGPMLVSKVSAWLSKKFSHRDYRVK